MGVIDSYQDTNDVLHNLTDDLKVTKDQWYKTMPQLDATAEIIQTAPNYSNIVYNLELHPNANGRCALYVAHSYDSYLYARDDTVTFTRTVTPSSAPAYTEASGSITGISWGNIRYGTCNIATNLPVFANSTRAHDYLIAATEADAKTILADALNYGDPVSPSGDDFEIRNMWTHGIWLNDTQPQVTTVKYRNVRGKIIDGSFALFPDGKIKDGKLQYGIISDAIFYELQYSTDGLTWNDTDSFPFNYFLRERVDELGEFDYALIYGGSFIPIFEDENTAQGYIDGTVPVTDAINWNDISDDYPPQNTTGDDVEETEFGEVKTRGFFSQQYICNAVCLSDLADDLFDTSVEGIWESIKKGLDMYGDNPIEAVMGLSFWPIDLTTLFQASDASYIWFGGYGWQPSGVCKRLVYPNGYKDIASAPIRRTFNSWRDMEPYSKLYIQLPYCGTYQLDLARYYGKTLTVRYFFDTRTNGCLACLIADGVLIDYFNGQCGVTMPITLTDYSAYMNAQISTLLGGGGQASQAFGNAAGQVMAAGSGAALAGAAVGGMLGVGVAGAGIAAKTVYGLSQNNINNFNKTKGGSSSMIGEYLPQNVYLIWEIQEDCAPPNYGEMFGYPSMKAGKLMNFTGFLKCQAVKLNCPVATERERERMKQMLLSGVYI